MKRGIHFYMILAVILLFVILFYFDQKGIFLQPVGPVINEISPNIIYNSQPNQVIIYGSGFIPSFSVNFIVGGSSFPISPSIYNPEWISSNEIRLNFLSGLPPIPSTVAGEISITQGSAVSNSYPFEIRLGLPPNPPSVVQVTPINLENPANLGVLPVKIWGNNFDNNAKIILDGIDLSSRILSRTDKEIQFYLSGAEIEDAMQIRVDNEGNVRSNKFNIDETTVKYPDIIHLTPTTSQVGSTITIIGHNFFPTTSELYVDNNLVPKVDYSLINNIDKTFTILLQLNSLSNGAHSVHFDTPPRRPSVNYNRYNSSKVYFQIKSSLSSPIIIENNNLSLAFDGNVGSLIEIKNKETNHIYTLESMFPWRIQLRPIVNSTNLSAWLNPPQSNYFNPYLGNCTSNLTYELNQQGTVQNLKLIWNDCTIDQNNHFDYVQEYLLEDDNNYVEMKFYTNNSDVINYSIYVVKNYITFIDNDPSLQETGMQSGRGLEIIKNPGYNTLSKGGRNVCYDYTEPEPAEGQPVCETTGYESLLPAAWINTDGDGYYLHPNSLLDLWIGYWNEEGEYIYAMPIDNYSYAKGYSYVGEHGIYKNTAVALYPNSFNASNFDYKQPYKYRIGVSKGTTFTGKETWINIADTFKKIQKDLGMLNTPFKLRDIPEHVRYLDLTTLVRLDGEFFDVVGGILVPKPNPKSVELSKLFETSRKYFGAEESTIFIWGGEQNRVNGLRYEPIPGTTMPFLEKLNDAGWNPCFYSVNGALQLQTNEQMYSNMLGQETEFDPTGQPVIIVSDPQVYGTYTMTSAYSTAIGPLDSSYLKWFLEKYRAFNNNGKGMRCFYSDGIFVSLWYGSGGPWSKLYNQKGWDEKALPSLKEFFKKEFEELRKIDNDTYTFHEAVSQFSTDEGLFPVQAVPGGIVGVSAGAGTQVENSQSIQFYQRIWGGYQDFILSNELVDPNLISPVHIPESFYSTLKNINGVNQNYNKTLEETYALPGMVGFLNKGAIPFYLEPGARETANYTPIVNFTQAPPGAIQSYWNQPLQKYAEVNRELVQARQLARNYFHGLWHLGVTTNSPEETYYYISDFYLFLDEKDSGIAEISVPRVISSVRQSWGQTDWANRYGIMFINTYNREPEQIVTFNFNFDRYNAIRGQDYNLFRYSKEDGRTYLGTYSNNFDYTLTIPARKFVLLELEKDGDGDNDGVAGRYDICPNTETGEIVNLDGCPIPSTSEFSSQLTTNLALSTNLLRQTGLSIGINNLGRIEYNTQEIRLLRFNNRRQSLDGLDIDKAIEIINNKISVNSVDYPELNKPARLTFYNLTYANSPTPTVQTSNGFSVCFDCISSSYLAGNYIMTVSNFSNYSTQTSTCGDNYCNLHESCSICSSDCGSCSAPAPGPSGGGGGGGGGGRPTPKIVTECSDKKDNDNDGYIDYPYDSGCLNKEDNIELDAPILNSINDSNGLGNVSEGDEEEEPIVEKDVEIRLFFWLTILVLAFGIIIAAIITLRSIRQHKRLRELYNHVHRINSV
ncbi:MAG: hypothetical protein AABX96_02755 [Nanoarchaeota archaeon]